MSARFSSEEFENLKRLLSVYEWGLAALMTKLNIINDDLRSYQENSSIDHIASRIKAPESIAQKLHSAGVEVTAENAKKHLRDIAGVRVITSFAKDISFLVELIRTMPDVNIIDEKDYINTPKQSGYRSYHMIVEVPVFFSGASENITVEIQLRTSAMNFWATLEHKARYKYREHIPTHLSDELAVIADKIADLDQRMYLIHEIINLINE
ncbi:MAG: GTP pyrophosphokinase family protein [Oscillospiraceae bacterium]|nr:GTP pyrophosphokinase family protein [Oscillospiraceae bacterium]